ncbi:MAG: M24 family metallopeptidase [Candidatus Hydrothermarchaeota archaeon]
MRIETLRKKMEEKNIDAAILIYSRDVLYYAGTSRPCNLLITRDDAFLFVRRAYEFVEKETYVKNLIKGGSFKLIKEKLDEYGIKEGVIGLELDIIPAKLYLSLKKVFPNFAFLDISPLILEQRLIKDKEEIKYTKKSAKITDRGQSIAREAIREGMTELELAVEVESEMRRNRHEGIIFNRRFDANLHYGLISSGDNLDKMTGFANVVTGVGLSKSFPQSASERVIKKGDMIVIDIGGVYKGYHSDNGRTYVIGKIEKRQVEVFDELKEVQQEILDNVCNGLKSSELYEIALKKANEGKYSEFFMGYGENKGNFVGHGLGLEIDEPPTIGPYDQTVLRKNMILAIELNTIIPEWGAVKLEDTILIKKDGYEVLTDTEREIFSVG